MMTNSNRSKRRTLAVPVALAVFVVILGGSLILAWVVQSRQTDTITPAQARDIQASVAALPKCGEVFKAGQRIDQAKAAAGCLDARGGVQAPGSFQCGDGRTLWQVDASTGARAGWGYGGDAYHESKDAASDPKYKQAYEKCTD